MSDSIKKFMEDKSAEDFLAACDYLAQGDDTVYINEDALVECMDDYANHCVSNSEQLSDKTSLSDKLWKLDKKLISGHHYIKLGDALQLVSQKKLDQKS